MPSALPFASGAPASADGSPWVPRASSPGPAAWVVMANRAPRTATTTIRANATQTLRFQGSLTSVMTSSVTGCGGDTQLTSVQPQHDWGSRQHDDSGSGA